MGLCLLTNNFGLFSYLSTIIICNTCPTVSD